MVLAVTCLVLPCLPGRDTLHAAPPKLEDHVKLKSGVALAGKVVGEVKLDIGKAYRVKTDFGELYVPKRAASKVVANEKPDPKTTFSMRRIRVVRFKGTVERRAAGGNAWQKISWTDRYKGRIRNSPNALVAPGDTIRTAKDSEIDLMPHQDVWIRIAANSVVEIPPADPTPKEGSYTLKKGKTLQQVKGKPRGQVFRVRTPLTLLSVKGTFFRVGVTSDLESCSVKEGVVAVGRVGEVGAGEARTWTASASESDAFKLSEFEFEMVWFPLDRMALIPRGTYQLAGPAMGGESGGRNTTGAGPKAKKLLSPGESSFRKRVRVRLDGVLLDRRELSIDDYRRCMAALDLPWASTQPETAPRGHAVELSFDLATQCLAWLGRRLPTESEWEAGARGVDKRPYPWGRVVPSAHWDWLVDSEKGRVTTAYAQDVASETYDVSPFGLRAMATSLSEWTGSRWRDAPFFEVLRPTLPFVDDAIAFSRDQPAERRVIRGFEGAFRVRWSEYLSEGLRMKGRVVVAGARGARSLSEPSRK